MDGGSLVSFTGADFIGKGSIDSLVVLLWAQCGAFHFGIKIQQVQIPILLLIDSSIEVT